jgi:hypothetical protein
MTGIFDRPANRRCSRCDRLKPSSAFGSTRSGGRSSVCSDCRQVGRTLDRFAPEARAARREEQSERDRRAREAHQANHPRLCIGCGKPAISSRHWYCAACSSAAVERRRQQQAQRDADPQRRTEHAKLYDAKHKRLRAEFARLVDRGGVRCWRCGDLIAPGSLWDLGHVDGNPGAYRGPEHRRCNRATSGRRSQG